MKYRRTALAGTIGLILCALAVVGSVGIGAQTLPQRIPFQILTGSTGGSYFPLGQLIAGLISRPPGVDQCIQTSTCGPRGLIVTARTSDGAVANVLAVNQGAAESGFAQQDVITAAVAGLGVFKGSDKQKNIRILTRIFSEDMHLVVAANSTIKSVADLKGKRVSIGAESSGTALTARAILSAYGIASWRVKTSTDSAEVAAQRIKKGELDALFLVGARPVSLVDALIASGAGRLVAIDGNGRDRLIKNDPALFADVIPSATYRGEGNISTVGVPAFWIVNRSVPDAVVYGITKAFYSAANRAVLRADLLGKTIHLADAIRNLPAPLHPGAARYFRDVGILR